ncbi:DUF421 domain-containing protein [Terribacillus saccharophilus]|uniref:DUF421 domain-containing protein n=1 Tax=Terribacillus saccharophilus TaxID=361277 RepID=UPI003982B782
MDFFQSQQTLTTFEWVLRAVVSFIFLLIVAKVLGQRSISQLRLLDFVIALVVGNIIAHPLSDEELGLKGSIVTTIVLVLLYLAGIFLILRWPWFRKLINHKPIPIVRDGEILYKGLRHARISIDVLLEELRKGKVVDIKKVALALWEAEGRISFFLDPKYEPVTPDTMQINMKPFYLPRTVIKDGKIVYEELKETNKDEAWVVSQLKRAYQTEVKDVLLATISNNEKFSVFLYR